MPNPASFTPLELPTEYEAEWDPRGERDGHPFEHVTVKLPNNYAVSFARTAAEGGTIGYSEGRWEAALMRPLPENDLRRLFGQGYEAAEDLDDLTTDEVEGWRVVGNLDNEGVNALLVSVAGRPTYEVPEVAESDPFAAFFEGVDLDEAEGESL